MGVRFAEQLEANGITDGGESDGREEPRLASARQQRAQGVDVGRRHARGERRSDGLKPAVIAEAQRLCDQQLSDARQRFEQERNQSGQRMTAGDVVDRAVNTALRPPG